MVDGEVWERVIRVDRVRFRSCGRGERQCRENEGGQGLRHHGLQVVEVTSTIRARRTTRRGWEGRRQRARRRRGRPRERSSERGREPASTRRWARSRGAATRTTAIQRETWFPREQAHTRDRSAA